MLARPEWLADPALPAVRPRPSLPARLRIWWVRMAERRQLAGLDARALRDIGITSADAQHEASKPFWRE